MRGVRLATLLVLYASATKLTEAAPLFEFFTQAFNAVAQVAQQGADAVNQNVVKNVVNAGNVVGNGIVQAANVVGDTAVTTANGINSQVIGGIKDFGLTIKNTAEQVPQTVSVIGTQLDNGVQHFINSDLVIQTLGLAVDLASGVAEGYEMKEEDQQQITSSAEDINRIWDTMDDYVKIYYAAFIPPQKYEALKAILNKDNRENLAKLVERLQKLSDQEKYDYLVEGQKRYNVWIRHDASDVSNDPNNHTSTPKWNSGGDMYLGD